MLLGYHFDVHHKSWLKVFSWEQEENYGSKQSAFFHSMLGFLTISQPSISSRSRSTASVNLHKEEILGAKVHARWKDWIVLSHLTCNRQYDLKAIDKALVEIHCSHIRLELEQWRFILIILISPWTHNVLNTFYISPPILMSLIKI